MFIRLRSCAQTERGYGSFLLDVLADTPLADHVSRRDTLQLICLPAIDRPHRLECLFFTTEDAVGGATQKKGG